MLSLSVRVNPSADRRLFLCLMASLIGLAWVSLWMWDRSPYAGYLHHAQLGELGASGPAFFRMALYLLGWILMTTAMMLPTTIPLLEIFRRLTARRPDRGVLLSIVIAGYLAAWLGFGIAAHLGDWLLHEMVEHIAWLGQHAWIIGAGTLILAGAFQFTALKYRCLDKCRAPLSFVTEYWRGRHDRRNALMLGVNHGIFCVSCCWALMLLMFGVGVGNVGWMLVLAALMAMEKNMPWGRRLSASVGVALLGCGALVLVRNLIFSQS
jgi:predicted metal-binding membrane protein